MNIQWKTRHNAVWCYYICFSDNGIIAGQFATPSDCGTPTGPNGMSYIWIVINASANFIIGSGATIGQNTINDMPIILNSAVPRIITRVTGTPLISGQVNYLYTWMCPVGAQRVINRGRLCICDFIRNRVAFQMISYWRLLTKYWLDKTWRAAWWTHAVAQVSHGTRVKYQNFYDIKRW